MKSHSVSRLAATALICLLPFAAQSAAPQTGNADADMSADELAAIADRMRETSEKMLADLKKARSRFEARKQQLEIQQRQEAEQGEKVALAVPAKKTIKKKPEPPQESPAQALARQEAEREQAEIRAMEERAAQALAELNAVEEKRARAVKALAEARQQKGISAFSDSDQ
jgi:hypothetical protein